MTRTFDRTADPDLAPFYPLYQSVMTAFSRIRKTSWDHIVVDDERKTQREKGSQVTDGCVPLHKRIKTQLSHSSYHLDMPKTISCELREPIDRPLTSLDTKRGKRHTNRRRTARIVQLLLMPSIFHGITTVIWRYKGFGRKRYEKKRKRKEKECLLLLYIQFHHGILLLICESDAVLLGHIHCYPTLIECRRRRAKHIEPDRDDR